jgi:hypothetical protein
MFLTICLYLLVFTNDFDKASLWKRLNFPSTKFNLSFMFCKTFQFFRKVDEHTVAFVQLEDTISAET